MRLQRLATLVVTAGIVAASLSASTVQAQGGGGRCQRGGMSPTSPSTGTFTANPALTTSGYQLPLGGYSQLGNSPALYQQALMQQQMAQSYAQQQRYEQAYKAELKAEESARAEARVRYKVEKQQRAEAAKARRIARANKAAGATKVARVEEAR